MRTILLIVLFVVCVGQSLADSVTETTKLISTILMFRHGDRTPLLSRSELSTDPEAVEAASALFGYGQLTDVGKRRCYELGESIRARYGELLSPRYNRSEIYIRSTDYTRTEQSVLTAMAAVYSTYPGSWSDEINWVPTPYTTVPPKYDFNLFNLNCPNFIKPYSAIKNSTDNRVEKYTDILNVIAASSGHNMSSTPTLALFIFYDIYVNQLSLGIPLSPEIAAIMPELKKAAGEAIDILFGNDDYIALQAGVPMHEFFTQADKIIAGMDTPRVRVYSAHETTVYFFEAAAQVYPRQGVPEYAAYFALELRTLKKTGEYVVLPVYQTRPSEKPIYLRVAGCNCDTLLCPYDTYKSLVSKYALDEDTWRTKCGFTGDLVIDESSIQ